MISWDAAAPEERKVPLHYVLSINVGRRNSYIKMSALDQAKATASISIWCWLRSPAPLWWHVDEVLFCLAINRRAMWLANVCMWRTGVNVRHQWAQNLIITLSLRQNDITTSFWRNNDAIITWCVHWGYSEYVCMLELLAQVQSNVSTEHIIFENRDLSGQNSLMQSAPLKYLDTLKIALNQQPAVTISPSTVLTEGTDECQNDEWRQTTHGEAPNVRDFGRLTCNVVKN